ncbi:unnamed protein product [Orchesella dallaii]|uniref:Uncharacterized protein n=1 Tax=Orchesella dallaii TaxID=48710 RepID=A0ABP1RFU3_9HEXA
MEINFQLRFQTILALIHFVENMEWETMLLMLMSLLMTPFIFGSLWSVGWTLVWQLFWLGLQAGILLFFVGAVFFLFTKAATVTYPKFARGRCSLGDVLLSLIFHCGLWVPVPVWEIMTQYFGIGPVEQVSVRTPGNRVSFAVPEATTKVYDVSPPSRLEDDGDDDFLLPVPRRMTRSSPKEIYTLPTLLVPADTADSIQHEPSAPRPENGVRQRRSSTRKQGSQTRRPKKLVFNTRNEDESSLISISTADTTQ